MRGGKREGAGRKPREEPRKPISVKVEPEIHEKFTAMCEAKGLSQSDLISFWVKRAKL